MFEGPILERLRRHAPEAASLEVPPDPSMGHYALPCFALAKARRQPPPRIAQELAAAIAPDELLEKVESRGPYVNFFLSAGALTRTVLGSISRDGAGFGRSSTGAGRTVVVDFSSPNIGKPFHFGHLRSTVIGNALSKLYASQGWKVVRVNHLGDWGTQFGALSVGYGRWGNAAALRNEPLRHLLEIYVRFHEEARAAPALEAEARAAFKRLEEGDADEVKIWSLFRQASLEEFKRIYDALGIEFDAFEGEAFYNDKIDPAISECERRGLARASEGALVVPLEGFEVPFMLRKSDGASTYAARDLAALIYRFRTYAPDRILYVVGREQSLHFQQLFEVGARLGYPKEALAHVDFGLYLFQGGKMASREGKTVFMEEVLRDATSLAIRKIEEKNPELEDKRGVAASIAAGALIFGDLSIDRGKDIEFELERIVDLQGDTGPYLQYGHARSRSILRKAAAQGIETGLSAVLTHPREQSLLAALARYPRAIEDSLRQHRPHILASYLLDLARSYSRFYEECNVLKEPDPAVRETRLMAVSCFAQVVANGLSLLGLHAPEEM
jgi:arginyl-tRNA synthetase